MNYYEHHLGDYAKDAGHLSMVEEGAYRRLLDAYYIREAPLPIDVRECCKLARATTKLERDAVAYVLREFFDLQDDGHHQGRADAEIQRFQDKQRKARASAEARWSRSGGNANADADAHANASLGGMRTHSEGNAPRATRADTGARPSPVPSPQTPLRSKATSGEGADKPRRPTKKAPADFTVTDAMRTWAHEKTPLVLVEEETDRFRDYTFANAITDWPGAWRNWLRKAQEFAAQRQQRTGVAPAPTFAERDAAAKAARFHEMTRGAFAAQQPKGETIDMEAPDGAPRLLA